MRQNKLPQPAIREEGKRVLEEHPEVAQVLDLDTDVILGLCDFNRSLDDVLVLQRGEGARRIHHLSSRLGSEDPSPAGKMNTHTPSWEEGDWVGHQHSHPPKLGSQHVTRRR